MNTHEMHGLFDFWHDLSFEDLVNMQGTAPVLDATELQADFWPEDERIDDFLAALDEWRGRTRDDSRE